MGKLDIAICDIKSTQLISLKKILSQFLRLKKAALLQKATQINDLKNMSSISKLDLGNSIFTIRGCQVMIDFQLAELYDVETKRINEQVKRNIKRFPEHFMFQLHLAEWDQFQKEQLSNRNSSFLRSQFATAKRRTLPYVFTEQGVAMLSAVLSSETGKFEFT